MFLIEIRDSDSTSQIILFEGDEIQPGRSHIVFIEFKAS